jgi:hypothetical protein
MSINVYIHIDRFLQEGQEGEQAEPEIIKRLTTVSLTLTLTDI